jgi:hypothetical protein
MPAAAQGPKLPRPTEVFWSRINILSKDAKIMDQERAAMFGHTINDLRRQAQRSAHESSRRQGLPESHTSRISIETNSTSPNFTALGADSFRRGARSGGFGELGHVDHLVCRDGGIAEGHGTRAVSGAGEDRRRPQALRRLLSTRLPPRLAPPSGAEIRPSRRLQQRHQGAAMALEPSRQLEFEQNHAHDRG